MNRKLWSGGIRNLALVALLGTSVTLLAGAGDNDPPQPPVVDPTAPTAPPSDAVVLFDGKSMSGWVHRNGKAAQWTIEDGAMVCKPGTGSILSELEHGDAQIHVEFATPKMPFAFGQMKGNSGVYLQGRYEVQVLDSYKNKTYADGSCGAIYKQHTPLVNACRPPEEWQTYDMIFRAPKIGEDGSVVRPGSLTVLHNGVLIHDHVEILQASGGSLDSESGTPGPIYLQDHGNTVRFRNIWYRPLAN